MTILDSRWQRLLGPALVLLALSACDSSTSSEDTKDSGKEKDSEAEPIEEEDASTSDEDASEEDASSSLDGGVDGSVDGGSDAGSAFAKINDDIKVSTAISTAGHDRYYGVTYDKSGSIYAVGQSASTNLTGAADTGDYAIVLSKYLPNGELDKSFGTQGTATKNVVAANVGPNREIARGVVVQSTGKIVVAATVPHTPAGAGTLANDTDIALLRFKADGTPDTAFGTDGVKILDVTTAFLYQPATLADGGVPDMALSAADTQGSLTLAAEDKLVVFASTLGQGNKTSDGTPRTDSDFTIIRLTADGEYDNGFNGNGRVSLDIAEGGASARAATVLANGSIIGAGYTSVAKVLDDTTTSRQQPVLFKVKNDGTPDDTFATADKYNKPGVFYDFVTPMQTNAEAYGAVPQGDKFITLGYGPQAPAPGNTTTDFIFARFNADGSHDKSFGTNGSAYVDFGTFGDNGRALVVLDDKRIVGVGGGRAKVDPAPAMVNTIPVDGAVTVLLPDGKPDPNFGTNGAKLYNIGGAADFYWGAALAPDKKSVAVVGIAGAADAAGNDNGALLILKLQ